jgi:DNA-binding NarL/FixJ family response regulator
VAFALSPPHYDFKPSPVYRLPTVRGSREPASHRREEWGVIRLGVVDDHPVFRLGLMRGLERQPDVTVRWEAGSLVECHQLLEAAPVDVILMDLRLGPGQDALAATRDIRERYDAVKVIIISASLDLEAAGAARAAGASGYLPKDLSVADMVAAIRGLSSPNFGRWDFNDMLTRPRGGSGNVSLRSRLSRREREVLIELRRGRTNKEIAARLKVSTTTVNKHVQQILKKLQVRTRTEAVVMFNEDLAWRDDIASTPTA